MKDYLGRLKKSFQPRQWFECEGEPDPFVLREGDAFMWVYCKNGENKFEVGYFTPDRVWFVDSTHETRERAANRVCYLNGGEK